MTIEYINGNLLTAEKSDCIMVHGCNSKGSMGAGIAKQIKEMYPTAFKVYSLHERILGTFSMAKIDENFYIVNAITQHSYGRSGQYVDYETIRKCFASLIEFLEDNDGYPKRIVFPKIGAGLGGGDWNIIEKIIDETIPDTHQKVCYVL